MDAVFEPPCPAPADVEELVEVCAWEDPDPLLEEPLVEVVAEAEPDPLEASSVEVCGGKGSVKVGPRIGVTVGGHGEAVGFD